jgi:hypothetical protein
VSVGGTGVSVGGTDVAVGAAAGCPPPQPTTARPTIRIVTAANKRCHSLDWGNWFDMRLFSFPGYGG